MTGRSAARTFYLTCLATAGLIVGCGGGSYSGPKLHPVAGEVLLNGQPLGDARVTFTPTKGGTSASGMTKADGKYTLEYTPQLPGVPEGDYAVTISTYRAGETVDGEAGTGPAPEKVPVEYNSKSTLTTKVPGEPSAFRFDLKGGGKIVQPEVGKGRN